jgi:hypothetical protein
VTAERQVGLDAVLERGEPEFLEPPRLRLGERLVGEVCERRAAPEPERGAQFGGGLLGVAERERFAAPLEESFEPAGVEPLGRNPKDVARCLGREELVAVTVREQTPQLR